MEVSIIDYKMSNLHSVEAACMAVGLDAVITSNPKDILESNATILPGVGGFGGAMRNIRKLGLDSTIKDFVSSGKPLFGVCLGLQLLFDSSEEFGSHQGLGLLKGSARKFKPSSTDGDKYPVPQIGWNKIYPGKQKWNSTFMEDCSEGDYMYFVHSYYIEPEDKNIILSNTVYGDLEYCSSVNEGNVFATQFHPEKSGDKGISIYSSFRDYLRKNNEK